MTAEPIVAVVALGRAGALGEVRRIESWTAIAEACGAQVHTIRLCGRRAPVLAPRQVGALVRGLAVPEHLVWSLDALERELDALQPSAVVCLTTRAFHPALAERGNVVLDLVDSMADSYAQRARSHPHPLKRAAYGPLAVMHRVAERNVVRGDFTRVVAGYGDAERFDAAWMPNVLPADAAVADGPPNKPEHDLVFFGSLGYAPNVAALAKLAAWWPTLAERLPHLSLLAAGRQPDDVVRTFARQLGWTLEEDYDDVTALCRRARVAVAPLPHAAGFQNKVLEAAAAGVPQIVSPAVARGLDPQFPVVVADDGEAFAEELHHLLSDDDARRSLALRALGHVDDRYRAAHHTGVLRPHLPVPAPAGP